MGASPPNAPPPVKPPGGLHWPRWGGRGGWWAAALMRDMHHHAPPSVALLAELAAQASQGVASSLGHASIASTTASQARLRCCVASYTRATCQGGSAPACKHGLRLPAPTAHKRERLWMSRDAAGREQARTSRATLRSLGPKGLALSDLAWTRLLAQARATPGQARTRPSLRDPQQRRGCAQTSWSPALVALLPLPHRRPRPVDGAPDMRLARCPCPRRPIARRQVRLD